MEMRDKELRQQNFIERSISKFGNKFDYSKTDYIDLVTPVEIICPNHGLFKIQPSVHNKSKTGCQHCAIDLLAQDKREKSSKDFFKKAYEKFGDKFDYSKVEFINNNTPVEIICQEHGVFEMTPKIHINISKYGCQQCANDSMSKNRADKNKSEFLTNAKNIHGDKYDYSKVDYINNTTPVEIICSEHGSFKMLPVIHLNYSKSGCRQCSSKYNKNTSNQKNKIIFLRDAKKIHGDKFDYSLVEYSGNNTPVKIICSHHGVFEMAPYTHKISKTGCSLCSYKQNNDKKTKPLQYYIDKANEKHGFKYDYSLITTTTVTDRIKVPIKCPNGHIFTQTLKDHITGNGCKYCSKPCHNTESFVKLSSKVHHGKYDYSKTEYTHQKIKVIVICPDHGEFLVTPTNHYALKRGCPHCKTSHGENKIKFLLEQQSIDFIQQKTFKDCRDSGMLKFDFYLPKYNACIEYDGIQHFKPVEQFGGQEYFEDIQIKDGIKNEFCKSNDILLLRISYKERNIEKKVRDLFAELEENL